MASPKKLYPGQREGETVLQYLRRKRWEESQMKRLGIDVLGIPGLTDQDPRSQMPVAPPPQTKEKTVITQVDDEAVPDKTVTTIEQTPPDTTVAATDVALPLETAQVEAVTRAPPAAVREQVDPFADKSAGSPDVLIARTLGMPVDLARAGINGLVKALGGPDNLIDNPVMGSRWLMENKGLTIGELVPLIKRFVGETLPAAGQAVEQALYPGQITQPDDAEGLLKPSTGEHEQEGILSYTGPNIEERITEETTTDTKTKPDPSSVKPEASTVGLAEVTDPEVKAALEREWGKWTYKPRERRDKFMGQLNRIYAKGAMLDAIAAFSGGQSRSSAYIERAMGKLNAITKFDQEERLYNIWRDVYYDKNGVYDAPKTKKEAAERARRLGANPEETKSIYGWSEEGEDLQQWYRRVDGKLEVTTTEGKKIRPPQGDTDSDWIMGTPSDRAPAKKTWNNWTDGKMTIYLPGGVSPADRGLAGDAWRKGSASESTGWAPSWKKEIGMLEKIAITDREEAITQAVSALRDEKYSHLYINQEDRREAAEHWIDEILANYAARGNIGIMEAETGNNNIIYGEIGF